LRLLLDTHVFLWCAANDPKLRPETREAIESPDSFVAISAAVAWELEIKRALKKLQAPSDMREQLELYRFDELPITIEHAIHAAALPRHHGDPFDRLLVAQAQLEGLTIVTRDRKISSYDVPTLMA
jgi:PIN domain nuclease of toxin-antitoxin system